MNKPSNQHSGLIELHIAVLLFGGTALFSKLIPLSALDITLLRCAVAAVVLALIVKLSQQSLSLKNWREYAIAVALGIVVSLHWVTYFASMQMSSVAIGMIAFFTYPVMTVLIEPVINRTRIEKVDILSGLAVLIGVSLLIPEASLGNEVTLGIVIGVISAFLFTARNLMHKRYFSQYSGAKAMCYQTAVAVLFLAPWQQAPLASIETSTWGLILLLGVIFTAAPHALFAAALRQLSAKTVGLVSCLQPFYGTVLALLILNEGVDTKTIIGGLLVVATAIFETQRAHQHQRSKG
ncbi:DMT family transporter [Shewanella waksmanii]|uniref:DMT family transporter n=1 Tax=Shewanella waksmanii TaxID=213783 RepID=UPI003736C16E